MGRIRSRRLLVAAALGLAGTASGQITSNFDVDLEGWMVYNDGAITYDAAIGNPAGSARISDFGSGSYFGFLAPAAYQGDKSSYYGGTLSFDLQTNNATGAGPTQPDIQINGAGITIVRDLPVPAAAVWVSHNIALDDTEGWLLDSTRGDAATEADIRAVLANITSLRIRGEFSTMTSDITHLDNVSMTPGSDCLADTNGDGAVTPADFSAWVSAFNTSAPECDQNGDGSCSPADFSAWVANYNAGC